MGTADAEIRDPSVQNPHLKVLPFKPGAGPYKATHATPTARDFFLASFYPSGPVTCIFSKTSPNRALPVLDVANTGSCVGPQNKIGHPAHCYRQLMQVPVLSSRGM